MFIRANRTSLFYTNHKFRFYFQNFWTYSIILGMSNCLFWQQTKYYLFFGFWIEIADKTSNLRRCVDTCDLKVRQLSPQWHSEEWHFAGWAVAVYIWVCGQRQNVLMLNVILLNGILIVDNMLNVILLCVILLYIIVMNVILLYVILLDLICWMSFCWMAFCLMPFWLMSLCWMSFCWMSF